ncbi:MAG TPA: cysteine desulfurase family protein [Vitreimonas sp.]|uniref:cysteine desulfurase family protein n=1 Tax=Vitreimonas sp. TaxID=3069702 RepID=UPI002D547A81|nr:cysteine desulfurase family protein [Vitreimonas sp.]HYD85849.1 cysteine desulfurase family protein [Vitreimonas sp.]
MTKTPIYCDYNAGAPIRAEAAVAMSRALALGGNASSVHAFGRRMRAMIEDAREKIAAALEAQAENIVFTGGASEALQLALTSSGAASLIVSAVEHDAVYEHAKRALNADHIAPADENGVIKLDELTALLAEAPKPALLALQLANNETGVIQPIARVAALCREHGALLLVDAAQAFGRIPVSVGDLDATYLVVSSHKLGGPAGAGALVLAPGAPFVTTRFGGGQERGRRPGTENGAAIVGFAVAVEWALQDMAAEAARVRALRDRFEAGLPGESVVFGAGALRLPNTSNFALIGLNAETAVIAMDLEGVAISSGAACSSGKVRLSRVLAAMGVGPDLAKGALRVSFGHESKETDVDEVLLALNKIAARRSLQGAAA